MSTIWLVFLLFPFFAAVNAPTGWGWRLATIAGLGVFALVYTEAFVRLSHDNTPARHHSLGLSRFAILLVLSLAMMPVLRWEALGLTPFLVSFASFFFSPRAALGTIVTSLLLAGVGIWLAGPELWVFPGIILLVGVSTLLVANLDRRQYEQRDLRTQMTLEAERGRVARDVHDVLGHSLTVITVKAELAERLMDLDPDRAKEELASIRALSRQALSEVRTTVGGLRSARLEDELITAQAVLTDAGIETTITGDADTVSARHRTVAAWVLREAVTNVVRHSRGTHCHVELGFSSVSVTDDGRGLPVGTASDHRGAGHRGGNGLRGLAERVDAVGGQLEMTGGLNGRGTRLRVDL
ncbi:MAG: sensor histidine kinase [Ornithinimicrobium sp.]